MSESIFILNKILEEKPSKSVLKIKNGRNICDIGPSSVIKFFYNYCEAISDGNNLSLLELLDDNMPIISEFSLEYYDEKNFYESFLIKEIYNIHRKLISNFTQISNNNQEFICILLATSPKKRRNKKENNRYHQRLIFHFPYTIFSKNFIKNDFQQKLLESLVSIDIERYNLINNWDQSLLEIPNFLPLYGSRCKEREEEVPNYIASYTFDNEKIIDLEISKAFKVNEHNLVKTNNFDYDDLHLLTTDLMDEMTDEDYFLYLLPFFLSISYYKGNISHIKTPLVKTNNIEIDKEDIYFFNKTKQLINMLPPSIFIEKHFIYKIGEALYNINIINKYCITEEPYNYFLKLCKSKEVEKFGIDPYLIWSEIENKKVKPITYRTIGWFAKNSNFTEYNEWHMKWFTDALDKALSLNDDDVAEAFYRYHWLDFIQNGKNTYEIYYVFDKHSNSLLYKDNNIIDDKIRHEFKQLIGKFQLKLTHKVNTMFGDESLDMNKIQFKIKACGDLINKLGKGPFIKSVKERIGVRFRIDYIKDYLDYNPYTFSCRNKVIEINEGKVILREGYPEDYITNKSQVKYLSDYDNYVDYKNPYTSSHPDIIKYEKYLKQLFVNDDVREYVKLFLSSLLVYENKEKALYIFIGDTNGGKSLFGRIISIALGTYSKGLPTDIFTGNKSNSGNAAPALARLENARFAYGTEPPSNIEFDGSAVKKLSGGDDKIYARSLYKDGKDFEFLTKCAIALNGFPGMTDINNASKGRIQLIHFESMFYKKSKPDDREIYNKIKTWDYEKCLKEKKFIADETSNSSEINILARAMLWMMVKYYPLYYDKGLIVPEYTYNKMKEFWKSNDPYIHFINECLVKSDAKDIVIKVSEIYDKFKHWYVETHNVHHTKIPHLEIFKKEMSKKDRLGDIKKRCWEGWQIYSDDEAFN